MKEKKSRFMPCIQYFALVMCVLSSVFGVQVTGAAKALIGQAQSEPKIRPLIPGNPVERRIVGGESHTYPIKLKAGQFLRLVVEQKGVAVTLVLISPDGGQLIES